MIFERMEWNGNGRHPQRQWIDSRENVNRKPWILHDFMSNSSRGSCELSDNMTSLVVKEVNLFVWNDRHGMEFKIWRPTKDWDETCLNWQCVVVKSGDPWGYGSPMPPKLEPNCYDFCIWSLILHLAIRIPWAETGWNAGRAVTAPAVLQWAQRHQHRSLGPCQLSLKMGGLEDQIIKNWWACFFDEKKRVAHQQIGLTIKMFVSLFHHQKCKYGGIHDMLKYDI